MLMQRVATACVLLALIIGGLYLSPTLFECMMTAAYALVLVEWLYMTPVSKTVARLAGASFALAGIISILEFPIASGTWLMALMLVTSCAWLAITALCFAARNAGFGLKPATNVILAFLFVISAWLALVWLMRAGGWQLTLSVFMLVWLADVFAYFCGRFLGRNRMAPAISPKKTWEGALGGLVFVMGAALAALHWLPHEMIATSQILDKAGWVSGLLIIVVLVALSIAGDLFESALKRQAGVKDSGNLLPGHGGFYDRLDATLSVLPATVALLLIL